jgi:2-polyprenyl-6-methoxyphenol hydroxylase-like FAD-dependent oxidoreductase
MNIYALHVIVVGGAAAGAGAALLLARAGARVTLIERTADPTAVGAGIAIAENGLAVLESIGLGPAIAAVGAPVPTPRIVDGAGRVLLAPLGPTPKVLMLRRSDLQQVLFDAVASEPGIERRFGAEVVGSDRRGGIEVRTSGGVRSLRGDIVIGADGVHSRIRAAGDHGANVSPPGLSYVRALVAREDACGEEAWTAAGLFGSFAVHGGTYIYASAGSRDVRRTLAAKDLDGFRSAWARAYPPAAPLLAAIERWDDLLINPVLRVECRRWFDGRQVLVGDAAHAMAPNVGQGANSALVDVAVLLDELRRADDVEAGFARYQQRRQHAVARVARMAARLGAVAEITNPVGRWVRDRVLMPMLSALAGSATTSEMLQEPTETLLAIGRA